MEKVIRDGLVAVIISNGYGSGWYTWNGHEEMIFHPKLIELVESNTHDDLNMEAALIEILGEEVGKSIYLGGVMDLSITWIPEGTKFKIEEYDGKEHIITENDLNLTA